MVINMNWNYETSMRDLSITKWATLENMEMVASQQELWSLPSPTTRKKKQFLRTVRKQISKMLIQLAQIISCEEGFEALSQVTS